MLLNERKDISLLFVINVNISDLADVHYKFY